MKRCEYVTVLAPLMVLLVLVLASCGSGGSSSGSNGGPGGSGAPAPGSPAPAGATQFVYVANSTAGNISGFAVNSDGSLSAAAGSPFAAPTGSLAADPKGQLLFSTNSSGSSLVSLRVGSNGALSTAATTTVPPLPLLEGTDPQGTSVYLNTVSVANDFNGGLIVYNYASSGTLTNAGIVHLFAESTRVTLTPNGSVAFIGSCYHINPEIGIFTHAANGMLTASGLPGPPLPLDMNTNPGCPTSLAVSPDGLLLAATISASGPDIGIFTIASNGALTQAVGSPGVASASGHDILWDSASSNVLVAQDDGVTVYHYTGSSLTQAGSPVGGTAMIRLVSSGPFVYALSKSGRVFGFSFSSGMLTPTPGSPYTAGAGASDLALITP